MSAIAGILHMDHGSVDMEHGANMMKALRRFPADDVQIWRQDPIFLGCHAQWITPESVGEPMPYYDAERQLAISADAILDNRDELFSRLNVEFSLRKTMPDSQLILLAYAKWGEDAPKRLVGDFAFMIWDERNRKLFGARDFSGARTLYYCRDGERFSFCTAISPLLSASCAKAELNENWLAEFLAVTGMADVVDASLTPYKNIMQVPPSHSVSVAKGEVTLARYSTFSSIERLRLRSGEEYVEAFRDVFQEAVTSRLRTHRQVGAQLSGGLDSGSIVGFAAKALRGEDKILHTFSYVPPDDFADFTPGHLMPDESPYIQSTVQHVGGIKASYLDFQGKDSYSEIGHFLDVMEMPYKFFENSFWMKGMFEKAREEGVGVLLNGGRGNLSVSWGAAIPYYAGLLKKLRWFKLLREARLYSLNVGSGRKHVLSRVGREAFPFVKNIGPRKSPYQFPVLINADFAARTKVYAKLAEHGLDRSGWVAGNHVRDHRMRHFEELFHWNASNTLAAKLSLHYSLWKRDPTNDLRVIRFCLSVPEEQYVQEGLDRALIRRAAEHLLPDKVRLNQRVRGVQGADWVHRMLPAWDEFIEEAKQLAADAAFMEYVDGSVVKAALAEVLKGARPEHAINPNFKALMRSVIVRRFIRNLA